MKAAQIHRIALALTFSPNAAQLLAVAKMFSQHTSAELYIIHIGEPIDTVKKQLDDFLFSHGINAFTPVVKKGEPAEIILHAVKEHAIDMLICGALEKENFMGYYIGSVARRLMREAACHLLVIRYAPDKKITFSRICATIDYSAANERSLKLAAEIAVMHSSKQLAVLRELNIAGFTSTITESESSESHEQLRQNWIDEEQEKMKLFLQENEIDVSAVTFHCFFGKEGFGAHSFASENSDLLVINAAAKKPGLLERVFHFKTEYIVKSLPCSILLVR